MTRSAALLALLVAGCHGARPAAEVPRDAPASTAPPPPMQLDTEPGEPFPSSPACGSDDACGWARCNRTAARCIFPCVRDGDCNEGARCLPAPGNADILVCAAPLQGP